MQFTPVLYELVHPYLNGHDLISLYQTSNTALRRMMITGSREIHWTKKEGAENPDIPEKFNEILDRILQNSKVLILSCGTGPLMRGCMSKTVIKLNLHRETMNSIFYDNNSFGSATAKSDYDADTCLAKMEKWTCLQTVTIKSYFEHRFTHGNHPTETNTGRLYLNCSRIDGKLIRDE